MRRETGPRPSGVLVAVARETGLAAYVVVTTALLTDTFTFWVSWWTPEAGGQESWWPLVVILGAVALVLVRHRLPATALIGATLLFGPYLEIGVAVAVISYTAAQRIRSARRRLPVFWLAAVAPVAVVLLAADGTSGWQRLVVVAGGAAVACVVVPGLVGALLAQRERLLRTLRERATYLERANQLAVSQIRLQEQSRIAQEMHDVLGHWLSLICLYSGALELSAGSHLPETGDQARMVRTTAKTALEELRVVLGVLGRRTEGQDRATIDGAATRDDLGHLVGEWRAAGVPVQLGWSGEDLRDAAPPIRVAVHRLVREALTNAHKHAGGAPVEVTVQRTTSQVTVEVRNEPPHPGRRDAGAGTGRGLVGLRERMCLLGGDFAAGPTPEGGFAVRAALPVSAGPPLPPLESPPAATTAPGSTGRRGGSWGAGAGMVMARGIGLLGVATLPLIGLTYAGALVPQAPVDVYIGMSEQRVRSLAGLEDRFARVAVAGREPPVPARATCWYGDLLDQMDDRRAAMVDRLCFVDGRLVDVTHVALPGSW